MKKKRSPRILMRIFFSLFFATVLLLTVMFINVIGTYVHRIFDFPYQIPISVWLIIICAVMGSTVTEFLVKHLFNPIKELAKAMNQVSEGNYNVSLDDTKGFQDIRTINNTFNMMVKELGSTEILKTEFISNVSHEFKTPINAIEGYATLLQGTDSADGEDVKIYTDKILFNTTRLSKLVGNILLLSKVDNQGIQAKQTTYRLDEQIRQSILSLERLWQEKNNEFDVDLDIVEYTGSENLLIHVWNNLIENAIKYGPQSGLITLRLRSDKNYITFTIDDEGPGISEDAQKHIFDRFYQEDRSRKTEGNGLGLALVDRILKMVNGTISVENLPEKGSRFTVRLNKNNR